MSRLLLLAGLLVLGGCSSSPVQPPGGDKVRVCLDDLAAARSDWSGFYVSYDDLDGFHIGLALTIHGSGQVEQQVFRQQMREARQVSKPDLRRLVALLQEARAWEQRT